MDSTHPRLDIPFYGLVGEWNLPRWLDSAEGPLGHPAEGVWLRHGSARVHDGREPWLLMGTLRRERPPHARPVPDRTPADAAFAGLFRLVAAAMPEPTGRLDDYGHRIIDFAHREAARHDQWPRAAWTVDGEPVSAPVFGWAGAWAGFTTALPAVDVVGSGVDAHGLNLAEVKDTSVYHFDGGQPLTFPETFTESRAAALAPVGGEPEDHDDVWWHAHPDHARGVHS